MSSYRRREKDSETGILKCKEVKLLMTDGWKIEGAEGIMSSNIERVTEGKGKMLNIKQATL